jgi:S-DNA-T family DNA segregation ATPase FtsK/SpoIIIE
MLETLSNNPALMVLLLLVGTALVGGATLWRLRHEWALFREWRAAGMPAPAPAASPAGQPSAAWSSDLDATPLPGAGGALKSPPSDLRAIVDYIRTRRGGAPYSIPLGWCVDAAGGADLITAQLVGDVNHILISGASDSGKDNAVMGMLLALARQHGPQAVQFAIIDGKGLDWAGWSSKAHAWRLALEPEEIAPAMAAVTAERRRRGAILRAAGVAKWDEYQGGDLPLLVIFISELSLLEDCTKASELTAWLNSELSAGRAFGLRFIIGTQNASNFSTRWRGQIGLYLAGFQPSRSADEPNTGLTSAELAELGAIAPSQLPPAPGGAGVFTAVQGRDVATVRASLLTSQHRAWVLSSLPDRPAGVGQTLGESRGQNYGKATAENSRPAAPAVVQKLAESSTDFARSATPAGDHAVLLQLLQTGQPIPIDSTPSSTTGSGEIARYNGQDRAPVAAGSTSSGSAFLSVSDQPVVAVELVPADEQARILAAAQRATSRRKISEELYNATGGARYKWVAMVCDAAGLLMPAGGAQ